MQLKTKNAGKLQSAENFLTMKESERAMLEAEIRSRIDIVFDPPPIMGAEPHKQPLSEMQKKIVFEINERLRAFLKNDKELTSYAAEYEEAKEISNSLEQKLASGAEQNVEVSSSEIDTEIMTVRGMVLCHPGHGAPNGKDDGRAAGESVSDFYARVFPLHSARNRL